MSAFLRPLRTPEQVAEEIWIHFAGNEHDCGTEWFKQGLPLCVDCLRKEIAASVAADRAAVRAERDALREAAEGGTLDAALAKLRLSRTNRRGRTR